MSKSLVSVHVEKNLCLPAALFLGAFRQEHKVTKSPWSSRWKNLIRKEKNAKREMDAIKIVAECGLSVGNMFDLDDVEKFQRGYFRNYQIIVISADHANSVIQRFPEKKKAGMKEIRLLLDNQHFDLVTNTRGFLMSRNFCATCEKPFSNKDQHLCEGTCPSCYRSNDQCQVVAVRRCQGCLRDFRNDQCFQIHKAIRPKRG